MRAFVAQSVGRLQAREVNRIRGVFVFALLGAGCIAAPNPMRTVDASVRTDTNVEAADTLVVMFPGLGDSPDDYVEKGFVRALEDAGRNVDVIAVDARLGHYKRTKFLPRIREDVFARPEVANYDHIWLVGISLGGLGAILTAREYEERIDGVVLLSPYLGKRKHADAVKEAGGLESWEAPGQTTDNYTVELWRWLDEHTAQSSQPRLFLGFGSEETSAGHTVLRDALPAEHVTVAPGGHGWTTWVKAWPALLAQGAIGENSTLEDPSPGP